MLLLQDKKGAWTSGLFDCVGPCPTRGWEAADLFGKIAERLGKSHGTYCCYYSLWCGCCCVARTSIRGQIREIYEIPGNCCEDCLTISFCTPCSLMQEADLVGLNQTQAVIMTQPGAVNVQYITTSGNAY